MSSKNKTIQLSLRYDKSLDSELKKRFQGKVEYRVVAKNLDARRAPRGRAPQYNYVVEILDQSSGEQETIDQISTSERPIIVGAGPAGLFCALRMVDSGVSPIIIERGVSALERMKSIAKFWRYGVFDSEDNVCFGAGGAGLFSDGKLYTRIKSPHIKYVMRRLVDFGAPEDTAYLSNPHLGSNKIRVIIENLTRFLESKGCEIHYRSCMSNLLVNGDRVTGVALKDGREFNSDTVVLATGHSAHDVYRLLNDLDISISAKDFAVGVRIEHPRRLIDKLQYGSYCQDVDREKLEPARYRLSANLVEEDRGVYSFCMCPGGYVLSSGSDGDGIVTNGMSNFLRNAPWSNAAIVVSVKAGRDFKDLPMGGIDYQRFIEKKAYDVSCRIASGREIPAQRLVDFLDGRVGNIGDSINTSSPSGAIVSDLSEILPSDVLKSLKSAFLQFDKNIKGFIDESALLLAPETRTSAPLRVERDSDTLQSASLKGLYPCGEGAGYAGGITSSAVDGIKVAVKIFCKIR